MAGLRAWSPTFDMSTIPDDILASEWARRQARKRKSYTGGATWAKHNPDTARCRCAECNEDRTKRKALDEWQRFHADAVRFGSREPGKIADILTGGDPEAAR